MLVSKGWVPNNYPITSCDICQPVCRSRQPKREKVHYLFDDTWGEGVDDVERHDCNNKQYCDKQCITKVIRSKVNFWYKRKHL